MIAIRPLLALLFVLGVGCGPALTSYRAGHGGDDGLRIHQIKFTIANVFAIESERGVVVVDTGESGMDTDVVAALARLGIDGARVKLIVVTHAHADHIGAAAALGRALSAPVALGAGDVAIAQSGHNPPLHATTIIAQLIKLTLNHDFEAFTPSVVVDGCLDLRPYGVPGVVRSASGHTDGSVVVILDGGDAIVGDIIAGGYLGGMLGPRFPTEHYIQRDLGRVAAIIDWLLDSGVQRLHVGHGGPLAAAKIRELQRDGKFVPPGGLRFEPLPCPQ